MKVNEIIQEGPMWDRIKSGASRVGSAITGAKAGYTQNKSLRQGQERIAKLAKDAEPYWIKTQAAYQQRGATPDQMGQYLTQWARKWYNTPTIPEYSSVVGSQYNANSIRKYLQTGASYYVAPDLATTMPDQKSPSPSPSPEEIRKEKLAAAARAAHAQMAANKKAQSKQQPQAQPQAQAQLQPVTGMVTPATSNSGIVPRNSTASSTGGTVSRTNKGVRHVSSPNNPNRIANAKPIR